MGKYNWMATQLMYFRNTDIMQQSLWLVVCLSIKSSPLGLEPKNFIKTNGYISSRKKRKKKVLQFSDKYLDILL